MIYLAEITAITDSIGTSTVLRYATAYYTTTATETPANVFYDARLQDPGNIKTDIFSDRTTSGATRIGYGDIVLINNDGGLDSISGYGFDGQSLIVRMAEESSAAYPTGFDTVFQGTIISAEFDLNKVVLRVRDKQAVLDMPVCQTRYAGNNVLPDGLEGVATDIGGSVKPRLFGAVYNISPVFVNTSKLTFQVNNGAVNDIAAVYDRGVSITKGADYATSALLQAAAPAAGTYITCFAEGYFRLGTSPTGQITADVVQGAAATDRTCAQILKQLALAVGVSAGDISAADVTALDAKNSSVLGIYIDTDDAAIAAMDAIANSIGAWYGFDSSGVLRMGRIEAPSSPVTTITDLDLIAIERLTSQDDSKGLPNYRAVVNYKKNYTVQDSDLAGAVTAARRAELKQSYLSEKQEDLTILTKHLLSPELVKDTLLTTQANATTEAIRLLALYKVEREIYSVNIWLTSDIAPLLGLGAVINLQYARFGLSSGKDFLVIGMDTDFLNNTLNLILWG